MNIKLETGALQALRTVDPRLVSYNVEMTEATCVELPKEGTAYVLSGKDGIRSKVMTLNGRDLVLGENDALPCLCGEPVYGKLELAPGSCAFIVL